jgi:hypothetical protein
VKAKKWVVEGFLSGAIYIPEANNNLSVSQGKVKLTPYAILTQELTRKGDMRKKICLGLEIPENKDHVCIACNEMESFIRALGLANNIPIEIKSLSMTANSEKWPEGIDFLRAGDYKVCRDNWEPADHNSDVKNRVRFHGFGHPFKTTSNLNPQFKKLHNEILVNDEYISELIKDYMMGLDIEYKHQPLAMLYYFKVLERVGKEEYNNPKGGTMTQKTIDALVKDMGGELTEKEQQKGKFIPRWRHNKSEAHLIMEGKPDRQELAICKKMARWFIMRSIHESKGVSPRK